MLLFVHGVSCGAAVAVAEAGSVGHELAHGGRVVRIDEDHFAVGIIDALENLEVGKLGDEF